MHAALQVITAACSAIALLLASGAPLDAAEEDAGARPCRIAAGNRWQASLRGDWRADLDWRGEALSCQIGPRPDGAGWRVSLAGTLAGTRPGEPAVRRLRLVLGIDGAPAQGEAAGLPMNLTLLLEGEGRLYATRGSDKCTVDRLVRTADHLALRGFCTGPATRADGDARLLLTTFDLTTELAPGTSP